MSLGQEEGGGEAGARLVCHPSARNFPGGIGFGNSHQVSLIVP